MALLGLCCVCYGIIIHKLGHYWEDWVFLWAYQLDGIDGVRAAFAGDRPLAGTVRGFFTLLLGYSPFNWHLLALIARWLCSVAVFFIARGLWPDRKTEALVIASFFAVYPGFVLQPISITFGLLLLQYAIFLFSLAAMIWAQRDPGRYWPLSVAAVLSCAASVAYNEYFIGLELLRPVLLWMALAGAAPYGTARLALAARRWSPYLAITGTYAIWRVFFFRSWIYDGSTYMNSIMSDPVAGIMQRARFAFEGILQAAFMAWEKPLQEDMFIYYFPYNVVWAIVACTAVGAFVYLYSYWRLNSDGSSDGAAWGIHPALLGLVAMVAGGLPIWFAHRQLNLWGLSNRYTVPMMLGASLFAAGLAIYLVKGKRRLVIYSVVVGLCAGFHVRNSVEYFTMGRDLNSMLWQLAWRAPSVAPGTSFIFTDRPVPHAHHTVLSAMVNFIYDQDNSSHEIKYWAFELPNMHKFRYASRNQIIEYANDPAKDRKLEVDYRGYSFEGALSASVALWYSPPSCLRVLDKTRQETLRLGIMAGFARKISDPTLIGGEGRARPPAPPFLPEPDHGWCYYFQKADLARQMGDWREVASLGDEARRRKLKPGDASEWTPFIEGYENSGRIEDAQVLVENACGAQVEMRPTLCFEKNDQSRF